MFLWLKAFHIIFMVCWFAGIFYVPRIFVYASSTQHSPTYEQLIVMAKRLLYFVTPFGILTVVFGFALLGQNAKHYMSLPLMHIKLTLVALLIIYHFSCFYFLKQFANNSVSKSPTFFRVYNELPVFLLFAIIILIVVKPSF